MRLSENGRKLIQGFEGLSLKAYPDADGYSIGYGHFGAKPGDVIDRAEADRLFALDVARFEDAVSLGATAPTQQQFDAMVSLTYNIGTGAFGTSTVRRLHNQGDFAGAADAFRMWNKSQGAVLPVLTSRREKERNVYLNGYGTPYAQPPQSSGTPIAWSVPAPAPGGAVLPGTVAAAGAGVLGLAALGAGLVFFCPCCAVRLAVAEIRVEPLGDVPV